MWTGKHPVAHDFVCQALAIRRSIADRIGEGEALVYLSIVQRRLGQYKEAIHTGLEALDLLQELGDRKGEAEALECLSRSWRRTQRYKDARDDGEPLAEAEPGDRPSAR